MAAWACCETSEAIAALASPTHKCAARPAALPPSPCEDDGLVADDFQPIERERMQAQMWPIGQLSRRRQAERSLLRVLLLGQRVQRGRDLIGIDARQNADRAEMMSMQVLCETAEDRLIGISRDAVDDQLVAGHAERDRGPAVEQPLRAFSEPFRGRAERGVPGRIHGVLVERNRKLDQKFAQIASKNDPVGLGNGFGHVRLIGMASMPLRRRRVVESHDAASTDWEHPFEIVSRPGDDMNPHQLADAPCGRGARIGRGLDRSDVTPDQRRHQARVDLLPADEDDIRGLQHGVRGFNHADQATSLDHAKRVADFSIRFAVSWFGSRHVGDYPTSLRSLEYN